MVLVAAIGPSGKEGSQGIFTHPDGARRALASVEQRIFKLDTRIADVVTSSDGRISMTFVWSSIPMAAG
jgi:hypothetical protein